MRTTYGAGVFLVDAPASRRSIFEGLHYVIPVSATFFLVLSQLWFVRPSRLAFVFFVTHYDARVMTPLSMSMTNSSENHSCSERIVSDIAMSSSMVLLVC